MKNDNEVIHEIMLEDRLAEAYVAQVTAGIAIPALGSASSISRVHEFIAPAGYILESMPSVEGGLELDPILPGSGPSISRIPALIIPVAHILESITPQDSVNIAPVLQGSATSIVNIPELLVPPESVNVEVEI